MKEKAPLRIALILFALAIILIPIVTQFPALWCKFNFTSQNTGSIASTINNYTAPLIGLLSAYLLYKALMAQVQSNLLQRHQHNAHIVENFIKDLEVSISDITRLVDSDYFGTGINYRGPVSGIPAIVSYLSEISEKMRGGGEFTLREFPDYSGVHSLLAEVSDVQYFIKNFDLDNASRRFYERKFFILVREIHTECSIIWQVYEGRKKDKSFVESQDVKLVTSQVFHLLKTFNRVPLDK